MKTLTALICLGSPVYREMANLCIASLRGAGGYGGEIALLTDGSWPGPSPDAKLLEGVQVVRIPEATSRFDTARWKWSLDQLLDLSGYDRVLVLDVDILAIAPLQPIFDFAAVGITATEEFGFHTLVFPSMGGALTPDEVHAGRGRWGINAGAICIDRACIRDGFTAMRAALDAYLPRAGQFVDQPPFNALIFRGQLPFTPLPRRWIEFPSLYRFYERETVIAPETKLLHFCGYGKTECLAEMQLSESLVASVRRGESDALRRVRLGWLHDILAAQEFHAAQADCWRTEATFHAEQSRNWKAEAEFQAQQAKNWQAEAAFQAQQAKNWEREALYQVQQTSNWQAEAARVARALAQAERGREADAPASTEAAPAAAPPPAPRH